MVDGDGLAHHGQEELSGAHPFAAEANGLGDDSAAEELLGIPLEGWDVAGRGALAERGNHRLPSRLLSEPELLRHSSSHAFTHCEDGEEEVMGAYPVMAQRLGYIRRCPQALYRLVIEPDALSRACVPPGIVNRASHLTEFVSHCL